MAAAPFGDSSSRASGAVWRQWGSIEARKWTALPLRLQERLHRRIRRRSIDCRSPGTLIPVFKGGVALVSGFLVRNPTMQEPKDAARCAAASAGRAGQWHREVAACPVDESSESGTDSSARTVSRKHTE